MPVKTISIDNVSIDANFRYSRRAKYLSIRLSPDNKVEVVLPPGYNLARAESFLSQRKEWIKKHLNLNPVSPFFYLGRHLKIVHSYDLFSKYHQVRLEGNILFIKSPAGSKIKPENLFETWLRNIAKKYITQRVHEFAGKLNLSFKRITIKGQKTRWGSCSSKKNLSFNYRLMKFREEVIDYVIIHELCHLTEMNHSERFWKLVEKHCPGYKKIKRELKSHPGGMEE